MTKFIEVNDINYSDRMLINVDKIIYVCEMGDKACIRYSNTDEAWGIVQTAESFAEICQMLKKGGAE